MTADDTGSDPDLVPVLVPRGLVEAVHDYVATASEPAGPTPRIGLWLWGVDDFRALRRDLRPSTARIVRILDVLAAAPDTRITGTRLSSVTGLRRGEIRGAFSGFTRVCRTLRADGELDWPVLWEIGPSTRDGQHTEVHYTMPAALARRWHESGQEPLGPVSQ